MNYIIDDRLFWIYTLIIITFVVIGIISIVGNTDTLISIILILWILVNVILLFLVYLSNYYSEYYSLLNRILINLVFVFILIFSTIWASQFTYATVDSLISIAGILTIIAGLLFMVLIIPHRDYTTLWLAITYIFIWIGLTIFVTIE